MNARQSPLGAYARKLLTQYLRRSAFMKAVDQLKFTIESAADIYLHVKKRQAQNIYEETSAVGGAYQWFLVEVAKGYQNGKIASGRDTEPCPLADRFFLLISDRETCEDAVGKALGARSVVDEVDIDDAMSHLNFLGKQTAGYMIFKTALAANSSPGRD